MMPSERELLIHNRDRVLMSRLVELELYKRQLHFMKPDFLNNLQDCRLALKTILLGIKHDYWLDENEDLIDAAMDCLQFGKEHALTMLGEFTENNSRGSYEKLVVNIHNEFEIKYKDKYRKIKNHLSEKVNFRWAEISYQNDLYTVCRWWTNVVREDVLREEIPCRVPKQKLEYSGDYDIDFINYNVETNNTKVSEVEIKIRFGRGVDCDQLLLDFINQLRYSWAIHEFDGMCNGVLPIERPKSLVLDSNELIDILVKKIHPKRRKETEIEPFLLGILCWDEMLHGQSVESAISKVMKFREKLPGKYGEDALYSKIKRSYINIAKKIRMI
jgi:hypothetical protein